MIGTRSKLRQIRRALPLLLCAVCVLSAQPVDAQAYRGQITRKGFWIDLGIAATLSSIRCAPLCSDQPSQGTIGSLAMGGTVGGGRWLIGGEFTTWSPFIDHMTFWGDYDQYSAALFTVRHYLRATGNTYVGAAIGGGGLRLVRDFLDTSGYAVQVRAGHDVRFWRRFSLSPYAALLYSFGDEAVIGDEQVNGEVRVRLLQLGGAFTWH